MERPVRNDKFKDISINLDEIFWNIFNSRGVPHNRLAPTRKAVSYKGLLGDFLVIRVIFASVTKNVVFNYCRLYCKFPRGGPLYIFRDTCKSSSGL
jgi:hypothetical protein